MAATHYSALHYDAVSVNPASIATVTRGSVDVTVPGIAVGDMVVCYPPAALNDDLLYVGCRVTAANTVRLYLYNPTVGAIDDGALTWEFAWWDRT
jgi:hypothetical protein